jgi:hypothetical protein
MSGNADSFTFRGIYEAPPMMKNLKNALGINAQFFKFNVIWQYA